MNVEPLVLVVDDEMGILRLLKLELAEQGFRVVTASSGEDAIRVVEEHRPDIILLDVLMPGTSGLSVMGKLRERFDTPVILVTGIDGESDKVRGLELGADDYIVKPFNPEELGARMRAVLRRSLGAQNPEKIVQAGNVSIDLNRRLVSRDGAPVQVTRMEWLLLQHLAANAGKVILNTDLLAKVWGPEFRDDLQYLRVWISRLRRKLEDNPAEPAIIKTMPGIGYFLDGETISVSRAAGTAS